MIHAESVTFKRPGFSAQNRSPVAAESVTEESAIHAESVTGLVVRRAESVTHTVTTVIDSFSYLGRRRVAVEKIDRPNRLFENVVAWGVPRRAENTMCPAWVTRVATGRSQPTWDNRFQAPGAVPSNARLREFSHGARIMIFLDFEASAGMGGYPIEVGWCRVNPDRSLTSAGKLIRHDKWLDECERWDWRAEQIHHISRANLMEWGESPAIVMTWLNEHLSGCQAYADSPMDGIWLRELAAAAGVEPTFQLGDFVSLIPNAPARLDVAGVHAARDEPKTHRAEQDARHLAAHYVALGLHATDGLICPSCGWQAINPLQPEFDAYCPACDVSMRAATRHEIAALPAGKTVIEAPTRPKGEKANA